MGYACPVCETPHPDGEHLAHHLAITASLHGDAHEGWLAEHVPDWADHDPATLADAVTPNADSVAVETVFDADAGDRPTVSGSLPDAPRDGETRRILREARALTERMASDDPDPDEDA